MAFKKRTRLPVDVNLTPLIDVVFLLLIFFMVTTTFTRETYIKVNLPTADSAQEAVVADVIEVIVDAQGHFAINGQRLSISDKESLITAIKTVAGESREQTFLISADGKSPHQSIVTVMEVAGELAFAGVSIATQKPGAGNE